MNREQERPDRIQSLPRVDPLRRRIAKGGLAAPVVVGSLLSRPVLGQTFHNCTISGQVSGNVSTHEQGTCANLGSSPSFYAGQDPSAWPNATADFLNNEGNPRLFRRTPFSAGNGNWFADAYQQRRVSDGVTADPTVREVLQGVVRNSSGGVNSNWVVEAKAGYVTGLALGQEAIAAYMNAMRFPSTYPLRPAEVVAMFNAVVVSGGRYEVMPGVYWNATDVLNYLMSLHA